MMTSLQKKGNQAVFVNDNEVYKAITTLKCDSDGDCELFELRVLNNKRVYSGYFDNPDVAIKCLKELDSDKSCYIVLNEINDACRDRVQYGKFIENAKTTSDNDIEGYDWLFIDFDPNRPADVSSSDIELEVAKDKCYEVKEYLKNLGFNDPIVAMSGNGYHLLYSVDIDICCKDEIKKFLSVLSMMFSDDSVKIDVANYNPARICKLYGTMATKGRNTANRPHRMAQMIEVPENIVVTDIAYVRKVCNIIPNKPQYSTFQHFDLDDWLNRYGIGYKIEHGSGYDKYILDECPFDPNHKGKDACIFKSSNGALGFHCFHNSCADKTWKDVRIKFEPTAYERKQAEFERTAYRPNRTVKVVEIKGGELESIKTIINKPKVEESFIRTGITELDKKMRGLKKGTVSVMSGLRGSAKSTLLSQMGLNAIHEGFKVGMFSGELTDRNVARWMMLQAAGKRYVEYGGFEGYYNVPKDVQDKIAEWMDGKFYLYNNEHGNKYEYVEKVFDTACEEKNLDLIMLDNLMAFNISDLGPSKWDAQTEFILRLQKLAKTHNVHVIFVAHPKKAQGFLRLDDISGTADLGNAVDNAFIVHRVNNDFKRLSGEMFKWGPEHELYKATNVVEVAKERENGTQDLFIPLWYEPESKRLKNTQVEFKWYGWEK